MINRSNAPAVRNIERSDLRKAGEVLARAFRDDPLFVYCFNDLERYDRIAPSLFASFARWAMLYGKAWVTSDLNGVALRQLPKIKSMTSWNTLLAGMWLPFIAMSTPARIRFDRASKVAIDTHARVMGDEPHWHCWIMGVEPASQGRGVGGQLMRHTFEQSDRERLPCYLETFSESSMRTHESQSYKVREAVKIPKTPLTLYGMERLPRS